MEESDDYFYRLWYPEAGIKRVIKVQKSAIGDLKTKLHAALRLPADVSVSYTLYVSDDDEWYECDEHDLPPKGKLKIETSSSFSLGTPKTEPCRCGKLEKSISAGPSKLPKDQSVSETLQGNDETTTDDTISRRSGKGRQCKKKSKRKKTAPKSDRSLPATQNNAESEAAVEDDSSTKVQAAPDSDCGVVIAEDTAISKTSSSSADQEPSQSEQSSFTQCSELSESPKSNSIQETKDNPKQTNLTSSQKQPAKFEIQKSSPPSQTLTKDFCRRINETGGAASETYVLQHVRHKYQHSSTDKYDDRTQVERSGIGEETTLTTKQSVHVNEDNYSHVNSIPALLDDSDGFDDDVDDTDIYNNDDTANLHSTESKYEDTQDNAQDAAIAKVPEIPKVKPCYIRLTALELTPTLQRQLDALRSKVDRSNSQVPSKSLDEGSQMHFVVQIPSVSSHSGRKSVMNIQTHHTENLLNTCKPNEATTANNSAKDFQKKERPRVPMKVPMIRRRHLRGHLSKKNAIPSCNDVKLNDTTSTSKDNEHGQKIERPRVPLKVPMVRTKHYFGNFGLPENKNAALNWNDSKRRICYQVPANALRTKKNLASNTSKNSSKTISSPVKKRLETPSRTCKNWSNASSSALKKWTKHLSILRQKDQRKTASASGSVILKNVSEKVLKVCDSSDEIANHNITFNGTGQSSDNSRSVLKSSERSRKRKPERPIVKDEVYQYETRIKRRRKSEDLPKTELGDARKMDMMCLTKDSVGHEDPLDNDDGDDDFDDDNDDDDETYQPSEDELTSDGENEISDTMKEELPCKVEADNRVEGYARHVFDENHAQSKKNTPWKSEKISQQLSINSNLTDTSRDHQMHSSRALTENDADSYCNIITIKRPVLPQSNPNDTLVDVPSLGLNVPEVSSSEESEKTNHSPLMNSPMTNDKASSNAFQINKKAAESISCSLLEVDSERVHLDRSANPTEIVLDKRKQETLKDSGIKHEKESLDMVCEEVISETILDKKLMEVESEESSNDGSSLSEQSMFTGSVDGSPSENETSGILECLQVKHVNSAQSIGSVNKIEGEQKKCKREETQAQVELNLNHDQECSKEFLRIGTNQDETGAYMYMSSLRQNRRKSERASDKRANKEMPENNSVSFDHTRENSVITTLTVRYDGDSFTGLQNTDRILKQEKRDLRTGAMSHPDRKDLFHCGKMENSFIDSSALIPVVVDDVMRKEDNEVVKNVNCGKSTFVNHKYKQYSLQQNTEKVNVLENVNTEDGPTKFIKEKLREKLSGRTSILTIDPVSPLSIDVDDSKTPDDFSQMEGKVHDMTVSERPNQGKYHLRHRKEQIIFIESDDSEREDLFFSKRMKKEDADERFDPQSSGSDSSDDASSNTITPPPRCPNGRFMKMSSSRSKKKNVKPQKSKVPNQCDTASNNTTSSKATVSTKSTRQGSISRISEDITHFEENESNGGNSICADEEDHGRYSLRKRSKSINLVESDVSEDEDDKQNKSRINFLHEKDEDYEPVSYHHESENESTDEYENYDIENRSGVRYEFHRPELEDKWEYMFGEKGTFERLQSSLSKERHVGNELCLYDDSEAFRKCFEYMEWNCKMKCIFCDQVFELFSDFVQHFFEQNSCEKKVRQSNGYVCSPCGKRGMKKDKMLKHLLRMKSHGPKTAAFIPKSLNDDELDEDHEQDWKTSFTPGYRCKVCNNSRVWSSLCDSIIHIKLRHTNEDQGNFVYRKQLFEREKITIGVQNFHVDMEQYKCIYCGEYCEDQDALLEHSEIHHKYESVFDRQHSSSHAVKSLKYFLRKKSESPNLMESDASDENDSTDQTSARKDYRYRKTTNRDKHDTCYEVQRPELEGKWEFMYGEKGTFIRLEDNHVVKNLCVYENSEAFEKCFDYMEWNANMRCIICNREFELFSSFILHFLGKNSCGKSTKMKNKYGCPPCGKDRMTKDGLIRHMLKLESHGEKTAAFSPKVNNEDKVDREVDQDELKSFRPGYHCKVCSDSRIWPSLREAVVHIKECHTNEEQANFLYRKKLFEDGKFHIIVQETQKNIKRCLCSYCGQVCSSREYLLAHYASFHQDMASEELGKEQLLCPHCGKRYSKHHRDNFNRHLRYHTDPVTCEICGKILKNRNSYQRHKRTHRGKTYTCFCGKTCSNSNSFAQHVRRHRLEQNERQHKCEECEKSFIFKHHLHNHIASHHSTERKFKCSACGAGFKLKHHLKQHIESGSACSAMTDKT